MKVQVIGNNNLNSNFQKGEYFLQNFKIRTKKLKLFVPRATSLFFLVITEKI